MTPPVLFLIFNRPELTRQTFERIRAARPPRLFVHADGPRADRPDDRESCRLARQVVEQVDWPCEVTKLFREQNLGCGPAVAGAIDWFFSQVEAGIILEDDCAPLPGFFAFCAKALEHHRDDPSVMHVSGMGFDWPGLPRGTAAFLSPLPFIWGWATWRRAWSRYRRELPPSEETDRVLAKLSADGELRDYWREKLTATRAGEIRTWDYQWCFALWMHDGHALTPTRSLVENLGTGGDSTHATDTRGYAPAASSPVDVTPLAKPDRQDAFAEIHRRIFAAPRSLDTLFRRPGWLWFIYLGTRRRLLGLKRSQ